MNKNRHRVIYSESRGQWVVVGELTNSRTGSRVGSPGKRRRDGGNLKRFPLSRVWALGTMLLAVQPIQAEIIADSNAPVNQQATVTTTANGIPQVNIQTPSAAGVSRNVYSRFDVERQGVVLNNSRSVVQTRLGGLVLGNPSLATGTASVILNEVNSNAPSQLQGYMEVAGDRAQVVVANPAGVTCDGCGFINANRATLTTGTPIVNAGNLEAYVVRRGVISFEGEGLDSSNSNYTDVIARVVQVNADILANDLRITTGANQVNAAHDSATSVAGTGASPTFSLDVSELGGMYAGKIRLLCTEAGIGVRNAGVLGASAGEIQITAAGRLENIGQISAGTTVQIETSDSVSNSGEIVAGAAVQASVTESFNNTGGLIDAGSVDITADSLVNRGESRIYGDSINIAATSLENGEDGADAAVIAARQQLKLGVQTLNNENGATLYSDGGLAIGGELDATRDVQGMAGVINNHGGVIDAVADIDITASQLNNTNTDFSTRLAQTGNENIQEYALVGSLNRFRPDEIALQPDSNDDVNYLVTPEGISDAYNRFDINRTVQETEVTASSPGQILAGGNIHISAGDLVNDNSRILAGGTLTADIASLINTETPGSRISTDAGTITTFTRRHKKGRDSTRVTVNPYNPAPAIQTISLGQAGYAGNTLTTGSGTQVPLLSSHLFKLAPQAAAGYLVETDPRFINRRLFLSSDFVLQQLSFDPVVTQKRLGDGFYEQRLVREQVAQLTGRSFLEGFANDEEQFRALLNNGITAVAELNLRPGIALSAAQVAQLTSDVVLLVEKDVTLPNGETNKVLVPQLYVRLQDGDLNGNGGVLSAEAVSLTTSDDINNGARIAGRDLVSLTAENINNTGGHIGSLITELRGRVNVTVDGGEISGENSLTLDAGQDIRLSSTTSEQTGEQGSRTNISRRASLFVTGGEGILVASAGHNLELNAAHITNTSDTGRTQLTAGNDILSSTVEERFSQETIHDGNNFRKEHATSSVGSSIDVTGNLELQAGNDVTGHALSIESSQGSVNIKAGNDIALASETNRRELDEALKNKSKGFLSSTTRYRREELEEQRVTGSSVSADSVSLHAGAGITLEGSDVVADKHLDLQAGDEVNIVAARERRKQHTTRIKKKSGVFSSGGFGFTIGKQQQTDRSQGITETAIASTVGSIEGDVSINADAAYKQSGSDVASPGGSTRITAESIQITADENVAINVQETEFKQSGLSISISNPVLDAAQTIKRVDAASKRTGNSRLKTLAIATKGLAVYDAATAIRARKAEVAREAIKRGDKDALDTNDPANKVPDKRTLADKAGGINLSVSLGSSESSSRSEQESHSAASSTLYAGEDIILQSTGTKADTEITGSQLTAANNIVIQSNKDIHLQAAKNTSSLDRENDSSSASVGVSFGTSGLAVTASVSKGEGQAEGNDLTYTATTIQAGEGLVLLSGNDTNLRGSVVSGKQVVVEAGGALNIESLQATADYQSEQNEQGFSVSVPIGAGAISGSINAAQANVDAEFTSVQQQAGIFAGDRGFQVRVQGNTDLVGSKIASTEAAEQQQLNEFETATLTSRDVHNYEKVEGSQTGINLSSGPITKYKVAKTLVSNLATNTELESEQASTTQSSIGTTKIRITDEDKQQALTGQTAEEVVASISADVTSDVDNSNALVKTDAGEIETELTSSRQIKEAFARQVEAVTDDAYRTLFEREILFYKVTCPEGKDCTANPRRAIVTPVSKEEVKENGNKDTVIAVNGIFNGLERAGELAYQNAVDPEKVRLGAVDVKPDNIYLAHYVPADGVLGEFLAVGYEKALSGLDYDTASALGYSNATNAYADILRSRQDLQTQTLGHSRGTIVQQNAFEILDNTVDANGNRYNGENLVIRSFAPAVDVVELAEKAKNVNVDKENIHASYFDNDPVTGFTTSNPTVSTWGELLSTLGEVINNDNSVHSCGGTGTLGCKQVEFPVKGGPQGTPEGNARIQRFRGGRKVEEE